ncbi:MULTISPECIES: hypothetical protein [unclassified Methylobacterium]|uniref:hypothetical protein n=1 Tax=unclassified Methylobacterium TaxID=2615210 RepID=UPI001352D3F3|nr:hypothetical protein [Methylobacterium sp. 2A]MWV22414.1 hypothetical protein [Methylobacterium sp. 2A]
MKIHESRYGGGPGNFHIVTRGDTLHVDLTYPNITKEGCRHIHVNQESVRASDGILLSYDYDRDGWSIQQEVMIDMDGCMMPVEPEQWVEVAFIKSWALLREPTEAERA